MTMKRRTFLTLAATGLASPAILSASGVFASAPQVGPHLTGVRRMQVGEFQVTALLDGALTIGPAMLTGFEQDKADKALGDQFVKEPADGFIVPVSGYLINTGSEVIAVDCGTLAGFAETVGNFHTSLAQSGVEAGQVDRIIATHLHPDHIGGLTDANGVRRFANAELIAHQADWDFWHNDSIRAQAPEQVKAFFDIATTQTTPYADMLTLVNGRSDIIPGIEFVELPGHTPGHMGVHLRSGGEELLIWGDIIHAPKLQFSNPDWTIALDTDADLARATRSKLLDQLANDKVMVIGSHLDFPGFGHVVRRGSGFWFEDAAWDYGI
ncbi:MAG: MBL fold metallo-hydrolase [Pseudoruegeria sp.]